MHNLKQLASSLQVSVEDPQQVNYVPTAQRIEKVT